MKSILLRNPNLDPNEIEDIYWGCVQQTLEQGFNIARNAALLAGIPKQVGRSPSTACAAPSMQALHDASRAIQVGDGDIFIIGGVEHMGHVPMSPGRLPPGMAKSVAKASGMMGLTAEMLGKLHGISRQQQDEFAARSHRRAHAATVEGRFAKEIVGLEGRDASGARFFYDYDEGDPPGDHGRYAEPAAPGVRPGQRHRHRRHLLGPVRWRRRHAGDECGSRQGPRPHAPRQGARHGHRRL